MPCACVSTLGSVGFVRLCLTCVCRLLLCVDASAVLFSRVVFPLLELSCGFVVLWSLRVLTAGSELSVLLAICVPAFFPCAFPCAFSLLLCPCAFAFPFPSLVPVSMFLCRWPVSLAVFRFWFLCPLLAVVSVRSCAILGLCLF